MANAKGEIKKMLTSFSSAFTGDYGIKEVQLTVSFGADGKFLGFGSGGSSSMTVTLAPGKK
ncbi:hypothetical protein CSQ89_14530 [Chitinimonas sp. BJB300]|nr:hypothetical protein CSQ89_14530 [Chitinimonas sp. BJB300]